MSAEEESAEQPSTGAGLASVGSLLASERREQQREIGTVASELHLRPEVVEALEAGDEARLPAAAFVRGYIKSYARLLGLDEARVMAHMPSGERFRPAPLRAVGMRRKRSLRLPIGKWLLWLFVLGALAALVVYGVPLVERLLSGTGEAPDESGVLSLPLGEAPGAAPDAPAGEDVLDLPAGDVIDNAPQSGEDAPLSEAGDEGAVTATADTPAVDEAATPAPQQAPAPVQAASPEPARSAEAEDRGPATVVLRFSADSWVEMEANGRKLMVGIQPAGSERTVRAEPPVQILIGNAPGVAVTYRGRAVDLESYQRGKVARVVLED